MMKQNLLLKIKKLIKIIKKYAKNNKKSINFIGFFIFCFKFLFFANLYLIKFLINIFYILFNYAK